MSGSEPLLNVPKILAEFSGEARLFPLPTVVLFPDGFAPLKVFEPRYLELVREATADDGIIAMAVLRPGYEDDYEGNPPIHSAVCLGRILRATGTSDGKIDLLLYGLARARVTEEIPHHPFRRARVEVLPDLAPASHAQAIAERLEYALRLIPGRQPMLWGLRRMAEQLRGVDAAAGRYADAMANASDLPQDALYELLEENDVLKRFDRLIHHLRERASRDAPKVVDVTDPRWN